MEIVALIIAIAAALFLTDIILKAEDDEIAEEELHRMLAVALNGELELAEYGAPEGADHLK